MKKLISVLLIFFGLFLAKPSVSLAQYGGAVQPGQVLGEKAQAGEGIPAWVFILIAGIFTLFFLFFVIRSRIKR